MSSRGQWTLIEHALDWAICFGVVLLSALIIRVTSDLPVRSIPYVLLVVAMSFTLRIALHEAGHGPQLDEDES
jgi:hypothetical protein